MVRPTPTRLPRLLVTVVAPQGEIDDRVDLAPRDRITIGRAQDCDLVLRDYGTTISRHHAVLLPNSDHWVFRNLGVNGSFENGHRIEEVDLADGIAVRLSKRGPTLRFTVQSPDCNGFPDSGIITSLIARLKVGDPEAEQQLWNKYADRIAEIARRTMRHSTNRVLDEEDIVIVTIKSLLNGIRTDRFPELHHRDQLWRLLTVITTRKATAAMDQDRRQKRGSGEVRGDSAVMIKLAPQNSQVHRDDSNIVKERGDSDLENGFDQLESASTTPDIAALIADQADKLCRNLPDDVSRQVMRLKIDGHTHEEIASRLDCTVRTVERRIKQIREVWLQLADAH